MRARLAAAVLALGAATGCSTDFVVVGSAAGMPRCYAATEYAEGGTVALAQSVPTARWLPCVNLMPVGWSFRSFVPRDGRAEIVFASDRYGSSAMTVHLRPSCDVTGMTEVPSEYPDSRRHQQGTKTEDGYAGVRHYTFAGGCITFEFDLRGGVGPEQAADITASLGFLARDEVALQVREGSDGRLDLDRPREESR